MLKIGVVYKGESHHVLFDEIKTEIQTEQNQKSNLAEQVSAAQAPQSASEPAPTAPVLPERMPEFVQEELKALQETIRQDARSGKYQTVGGKHFFDGTRLWHEGDYRQGTALLANFYPFLSRDRMQEKEILTQSKRLFSGYRYEVRYTLSKDGAFYFNYFKEEMKKQGFVISDLSVSLKDGSFAPLPFTASGTVRYDFELEHYLSDYPKLYYTWHLEVV
ncbi:MAG: hypothetical protein ACLR09_05360 [Gallintestinimicrobium sp.]